MVAQNFTSAQLNLLKAVVLLTAQVLKVCRTPTACLKMLVFEKLEKEKKFHDWTWVALNLQPSDLRLNVVIAKQEHLPLKGKVMQKFHYRDLLVTHLG